MRSMLKFCGVLAAALIYLPTSSAQCVLQKDYSAYYTFTYNGTTLSAMVTVSGETEGSFEDCMPNGTAFHTPEITGQINSGSTTSYKGTETCPGCYIDYTNGPSVAASDGETFTFDLQGEIICTVFGLFFYTNWPIVSVSIHTTYWGPPPMKTSGGCVYTTLACSTGKPTCKASVVPGLSFTMGCPSYVKVKYLVENGTCYLSEGTSTTGPGVCD